ncbi:LysR family transcriptional regulator [Actinoalloteichus sp. GBA129-24]|uniref:LysR family transcriptional regulator n=1 Tax=Actinoalloteichus sp. GBA129-24 TaxID=1612551 RepID=UPI0009507C2B|nr:LysR family transcriptional regulator [Actinoalloteichus sp. GBA129-24]APU18963.1 transcriptional regulator [Actinoalloteichus sp. GBA129-24]
MDESAERLARDLAPRLALLRAVATEAHVTRVAALLDVPQPTVSRWLARLGTELGTPVVMRKGRGIRLTRAGELLAEAAEHALAALEPGCRRALDEADPDRGRVALAFLHTMGGVQVPELLRGFRLQRPSVRFTLGQAPHETILSQLRNGCVDLGLTSPLPTDDPDLRCAPLFEQPLVLAVAAGHRLAGRSRVRIGELADEEFVGLEPGFGLRQITDELCAAAGFTPVLTFEGQETDTVRGLVAAGLGIAMVPVADAGPPPGVVEVRLSPRSGRTIGLVWLAGRPMTSAVRTFRDFAIAARHHATPPLTRPDDPRSGDSPAGDTAARSGGGGRTDAPPP